MGPLSVPLSSEEVLEALAEGFAVLDDDGCYVYVNAGAERLIGRAAHELLGRRAMEVFAVADPSSLLTAARHARRTGQPVTLETQARQGPGESWRWFAVRLSPCPGGLAVAFRDISADRQVEERLARLAAQQGAMSRVATAVAGSADAAHLFALVARETAILLGAPYAGVSRFEGADRLVVVGFWSAGQRRHEPVTPIPLVAGGEVERLRRLESPVRFVRTPSPQPEAADLERGYNAYVLAPVRVAEGIWGVVFVAADEAAALRDDAEQRLGDFAALIAMAVGNAEARAQLADQAATDALTGLANHRVFHERLAEEAARARRYDRPLTLALVDVDHFKPYNDNLGHQAGDRLLQLVAARLRDVVRAEDLLARVGGDEFAVLMPETDQMAAYGVIERARAEVAGIEAPGEGVTVSAGISDLTEARDGPELYRLADGALYWSKAHGRDVTWIYDPDVVEELSAQERANRLERSHALVGLRALARAIDAKDPSTRRHSARVAALASRLAGVRGWPAERAALLREAALIHDVGKLGTPDELLLRPDRLTLDEYEQVKQHAALGAQIAAEVLSPEQVTWLRGHHERPDGEGYPDGLDEGSLSEGAALLAIADAFDVMTVNRLYGAPRNQDQALAECRELLDQQFTRAAVEALEALFDVQPAEVTAAPRRPAAPGRATARPGPPPQPARPS